MTEAPRPLSREPIFEGRFIGVSRRRYRDPDGGEYERQVVEHPGAVAIVVHDEEFVYLVSQPREAVGEAASLEIPAGTLDVPGEAELACAQRELAEEVQLRAERWSLLHVVHTSPGYSNERLTIFEATDLSPAPGEPEAGERIEVARAPLAELDATLAEIRDAKSLVGLLLVRQRLGSDASASPGRQ